MTRPRFLQSFLTLASLAWLLGVSLMHGVARAADAKADLKFQVQLIWGTNDEKPSEKELKEVEPGITDALKRIFKWKNYFEVSRKKIGRASCRERVYVLV